MFRSLKYRNFRLFFYGQFVSLCGSWVQQTAQAWLVYRLTRDPMMLGLAAFLGQFPVFLFGFYAGSIVDQGDHLRIVRRTQALAMGQAVVLAALAWGGWIQVWHVFVLSFLGGVVNAFDMPARQVLIGELVEVQDRHNAIALNSTVVNASRIVGPAAAGLLIGWVGEAGCFALNAASFVSVLWALALMRDLRQAARPPGKAVWEEIGDGLAYVLGHEPIRLALFLLVVFSLAGLPIYVLLPVFAEDILHSGAKGLGVLSSASGLGATVGALMLARRASARGLGPIVMQGLVLFGLSLGGLALSSRFWLSTVLMFLAGWSAIQVLAGINTLLQELSSDHYRGRVMSFYSMTFIGLSPVGSYAVGSLASRLGVSGTVLAEAAVCVIAGAAHFRRLPELLRRAGSPSPPASPALPSPL